MCATLNCCVIPFVFGPKRPLRIVSCETYCNLKGVLSALWKVFHVKQSKNVAETSFEKRFELKFFFSALSVWLCPHLNGGSLDCVLLDRHAEQKSPKNKPVLDRMMFCRVGNFQNLTSKILPEWLFQPTFIT